jgi:type I restriction enzyme S subunit
MNRLDDLCLAVVDCEHKTAPPASLGFACVGTPDIRNGRIDFSSVKRVSAATYAEWTSRIRPEPGDVILTREAPVGEAAIVPEHEQVCLGQRTVLLRPDRSKVHPRYLQYLLLSPATRHRLQGLAEGSTLPHLNVADIRAFELDIEPSVERQGRIGEALGVLDDKIDLNRRVNDTIQNLLRAAFQQMESGGDGIAIEVLAKVVGGSTPSTANDSYWGGTFAWATPKDLAGLREPVLLDTGRHVTKTGLAQISSGLLPIGTVLLSSRAPIGYLAISEVPVAVNQGFIAMVPNGKVSSHFLLRWAESHMDEIKARANGTTFQEISKANFRPMSVQVPGESQLKRFDEIAEPLHLLLVANTRESYSLAQLRDALLPELISGRMIVN